jgi:hypothetical protein
MLVSFQYVNSVTLLNDLVLAAVILTSCPTFCLQNTNIHVAVSVYTCKPTSLQATKKTSVFFYIIHVLAQ